MGAGGPLGWEQSEEVAKRLLEDMKAAEAREKAARARDKAEGRAVAEAHAHGVAVERDWEQVEEIYQRLSAEMAALEARGFGVARVPSAQSFVPKLAPGQAPPLPHLAAGPPPHRTPSVQAALDHPSWEQEEARTPSALPCIAACPRACAAYSRPRATGTHAADARRRARAQEVYQRLAAELAELEERRKSAPKAKWIPKGPKAIVKSPSTEAVLAHPPWEQEQARRAGAHTSCSACTARGCRDRRRLTRRRRIAGGV